MESKWKDEAASVVEALNSKNSSWSTFLEQALQRIEEAKDAPMSESKVSSSTSLLGSSSRKQSEVKHHIEQLPSQVEINTDYKAFPAIPSLNSMSVPPPSFQPSFKPAPSLHPNPQFNPPPSLSPQKPRVSDYEQTAFFNRNYGNKEERKYVPGNANEEFGQMENKLEGHSNRFDGDRSQNQGQRFDNQRGRGGRFGDYGGGRERFDDSRRHNEDQPGRREFFGDSQGFGSRPDSRPQRGGYSNENRGRRGGYNNRRGPRDDYSGGFENWFDERENQDDFDHRDQTEVQQHHDNNPRDGEFHHNYFGQRVAEERGNRPREGFNANQRGRGGYFQNQWNQRENPRRNDNFNRNHNAPTKFPDPYDNVEADCNEEATSPQEENKNVQRNFNEKPFFEPREKQFFNTNYGHDNQNRFGQKPQKPSLATPSNAPPPQKAPPQITVQPTPEPQLSPELMETLRLQQMAMANQQVPQIQHQVDPEGIFVELSRLPSNLENKEALLQFLKPLNPADIRMAFQNGVLIETIVRCFSRPDATGLVGRDGESGIKIRWSKRKAYESCGPETALNSRAFDINPSHNPSFLGKRQNTDESVHEVPFKQSNSASSSWTSSAPLKPTGYIVLMNVPFKAHEDDVISYTKTAGIFNARVYKLFESGKNLTDTWLVETFGAGDINKLRGFRGSIVDRPIRIYFVSQSTSENMKAHGLPPRSGLMEMLKNQSREMPLHKLQKQNPGKIIVPAENPGRTSIFFNNSSIVGNHGHFRKSDPSRQLETEATEEHVDDENVHSNEAEITEEKEEPAVEMPTFSSFAEPTKESLTKTEGKNGAEPVHEEENPEEGHLPPPDHQNQPRPQWQNRSHFNPRGRRRNYNENNYQERQKFY